MTTDYRKFSAASQIDAMRVFFFGNTTQPTRTPVFLLSYGAPCFLFTGPCAYTSHPLCEIPAVFLLFSESSTVFPSRPPIQPANRSKTLFLPLQHRIISP